MVVEWESKGRAKSKTKNKTKQVMPHPLAVFGILENVTHRPAVVSLTVKELEAQGRVEREMWGGAPDHVRRSEGRRGFRGPPASGKRGRAH